MLLFLNGCTTTYYYASGEKAKVATRGFLYMFSEVAKQPYSSIEEINKNEENWQKIKEKNPPKNWENLSGVEYNLTTGESQDEILKKVGYPVEKKVAKNPKYDEIWEYDFCTMYFRRTRLKKLVFKKTKEPSFEWIGKRFLWFDIF
jgi:hypothetical protein